MNGKVFKCDRNLTAKLTLHLPRHTDKSMGKNSEQPASQPKFKSIIFLILLCQLVQYIFIHSKTENIHISSHISLKVKYIQEDSTAHTSYTFSSSVQYLIMATPCNTEVQNLQTVHINLISCPLSHHTTTLYPILLCYSTRLHISSELKNIFSVSKNLITI